MELADEAGVYAVLLSYRSFTGKEVPDYRFVVQDSDGREQTVADPYLYQDLFGMNHIKRFEEGIHYEIYRYMGAHPAAVTGQMDQCDIQLDVEPGVTQAFIQESASKAGTQKQAKSKKSTMAESVYGTHFAVWAPCARRVSVVGDFNHWDGRRHMMMRQGNSGIFSLFIPGISVGELYKYEIQTCDQEMVFKTDPYGFSCEVRPANASVVTNLADFKWTDQKWLRARKNLDASTAPISIYEVHLGSWKKRSEPVLDDDKPGSEFLNYREIAPELADYVRSMGYTHIELMPVMEHPLDESWGYQVTGYFAPTSRYGSPQDFMYFMNYMHEQGIGVILDWVPAHFPKDANGLARFDGTCLYEHLDPRQGEHPHWGTLIYNYGRPEVANFLIANALYWVDQFHADGIRMDAVASMLYLDYGKQDGEWIANMYGGNENLEAIALLQNLSTAFHERQDGALLIAEESTAWPKVTGSPDEDGLGFDLKWNMGWMNDFTTYMQTDPLFRKGRHGMLTFSMVYAYSENFVLVFSHDEVVHLKGSMLHKMPGTEEEKYANLRTAYGLMTMHPGKKLLFMGQEFAQESEWNEKCSLPWEEAALPEHRNMQKYVRALNKFYRSHPALYQMDHDPDGFEWLSCMDADHSIIAFMRYAGQEGTKSEDLLVICNFTPVVYENFKVGVPYEGKFKEIFNSDHTEYGGNGFTNPRQKSSKEVAWDGREHSLSITVPPLSVCVFRCTRMEIG
ncbi:MAG: 1,4-alpha-glucan branching protein GlgB [Lachnospiraceae bacterium]|nr:1,4-alpha-glucan branching protein GlgB [Lachnospiraceae bacterium]